MAQGCGRVLALRAAVWPRTSVTGNRLAAVQALAAVSFGLRAKSRALGSKSLEKTSYIFRTLGPKALEMTSLIYLWGEDTLTAFGPKALDTDIHR